jgi:RsiW-degrading membrane proteinase PrsW (M82 family)
MALLVGLLPVVAFLAGLVYLDSYKLVKLRVVVAVVASGMIAAGACYLMNGFLLDRLPIGFTAFTRYVSPFTEEILKALVIVALVAGHRVGFLVDAAIFGFAVGTGFAVVENLIYVEQFPGASMGTWIVRGLGTAIMHGGTTAMLAMLGLTLRDSGRSIAIAFLPGYAAAVILHSAFNHFFLSPRVSTLVVAIIMPAILYGVFTRSEKAVGSWLGKGFDADTEMLGLINSGRLSDSPTGRYLHTLKDRFSGPVVADILCFVRLHMELALRAKGILLMRENGFDVPVDEETREKFAEMRYLEGSIGRTGLLAVQPMLRMSHKDLWQLYMLGK